MLIPLSLYNVMVCAAYSMARWCDLQSQWLTCSCFFLKRAQGNNVSNWWTFECCVKYKFLWFNEYFDHLISNKLQYLDDFKPLSSTNSMTHPFLLHLTQETRLHIRPLQTTLIPCFMLLTMKWYILLPVCMTKNLKWVYWSCTLFSNQLSSSLCFFLYNLQ